MKGITLFAIDKNYKSAGPTAGMDALRVLSQAAHEFFAPPLETVVRQIKTRTLDPSTVEAYGIGGAAPGGTYALSAPTGTAGDLFMSPGSSP